MMILRFLGILLIFIVTAFISFFSGIDIINMLVIVSFILTSDQLICKFLVRQYMIAVAKGMHDTKEKENDEQ